MVVPPKHPKMIILSSKTHGCWVPPNTFLFTPRTLQDKKGMRLGPFAPLLKNVPIFGRVSVAVMARVFFV